MKLVRENIERTGGNITERHEVLLDFFERAPQSYTKVLRAVGQEVSMNTVALLFSLDNGNCLSY